MSRKNPFNFFAALILTASIFAVSSIGYAQAAATSAQTASDLAERLKTLEERIEAARVKFGVPGISLAVVKDGAIVFVKGFGYKDYDKKIAVTGDTEFEIGSATKAFTALSVLMSQEEGKLSINDNPKKYLPYFRINDAETDKNIAIRDLLSHSSGLNRMDLAMVSGKLTREELIRVAGEAKPTARLREKFQYQNVMFTAAGEIVAQVQKMPWEQFVATRIFKPLGMTNSNVSVREMQAAKDFSLGYRYNPDTKATSLLPIRDIAPTAPAGAINSSARDMTTWIKFMLGGGAAADGKRLISENLFAELTKPQMTIAGKTSYGFGWFLQDYKGLRVVQHGGNIDGFTTMVAMIPEKKLGFVMLSNADSSPIAGAVMPIVWASLLDAPADNSNLIRESERLGISKALDASVDNSNATTSAEKIPAEKLVGQYYFKEAGFSAEIVSSDGKLLMNVPAQPQYTLENIGGNKYKPSPLPDGFFVTFKSAAAKPSEVEIVMEQPGASFTMSRVTAEDAGAMARKRETYKDFVGSYEAKENAASKAELAVKDTALVVTLSGQPALALIEKSTDVFNINGFPAAYQVKIKREADGSVKTIVFSQPEGEFEYKRASGAAVSSAPQMTVDELMAKVVTALGGEANWRKLNSRVVKFDLDFVNQGIKGYGTQYAKAPNLTAAESTLTALGKPIGWVSEYFNGAEGGEATSFTTAEKTTGKALDDARLNADFYGLIDWKTNYKRVEMKAASKVGNEDVYVIAFEPEKGNRDVLYFSQKTFLPVKLESANTITSAGIDLPYAETYGDYRNVDGIMLPFRTVNSNVSNGEIVTVLKEVRHNVPVDDKVFKGREK